MKLNIYMKSGNVIRLKGIADWKLGHMGNEITQLSIERENLPTGERLILASMDLSQIEAITEEP